jgi:hypothetical protein
MDPLYLLAAIVAGALMVGILSLAAIGWMFSAIRNNQDAQIGIIDLEDGDF